MMQKISKAELAARLEARVECAEGGMEGLETLIYGWRKKLRLTSHAIYVRDWLYRVEVIDLSEYAGYDLT